ncbi:N-acetylglucosamine-6-phosphate deacetylase [Aliiroseovarius sp. CAU 1755]
MTQSSLTFGGGLIFDGANLLEKHVARFEDAKLIAVEREDRWPPSGNHVDLGGDILSPGYVDLQVNGGDGIMFNADPSVHTIARIAQAHRRLAATAILPTLITDTPDKTRAAIGAAIDAVGQGVPGVAGLHLEGPHLSIARKGAHDAALIRPMEAQDLAALLEAAAQLPALMVTIAPENVTQEQVFALAAAGVIVSLGHTDTDYATCLSYARVGARCATHLFNAMSPLGNREPGVVGAVLASGALSSGLIADGIHVHPATMRAAWDAKTGPGEIFLVSDAMAVAGTDETQFDLEGRRISRLDGRLTLEDGTLAGADLDLTRALHVMVNQVGVSLERALAAATRAPRQMLQLAPRIAPGTTTLGDMIRIRSDLSAAAPVQDAPITP